MGKFRDQIDRSAARRAAAQERMDAALCGGISIQDGRVILRGESHEITAETTALVEVGGERSTATRIVGGAVLAGGVGAIVGAAARKQSLFLTVAGPGFHWTVAVRGTGEEAARRTVQRIMNAAAKARA